MMSNIPNRPSTPAEYAALRPTDWLPTSVKEMQAMGWDSVDVVLFSPTWIIPLSGPL